MGDSRITPRMGAEHYQTFSIDAPKETHTKVVSCEDAECRAYANGWKMTLDLTTDLGKRQGYYIKHHSGRSYKVTGQHDGLVELEFAASQPCFQEHRQRIARPEIFAVKGGDFRGNPLRTPKRVHKKPEFWVEEFAEHQDKINQAIKKG